MKVIVIAVAFAALVSTAAFAQSTAARSGETADASAAAHSARIHHAPARHRAYPTNAYGAMNGYGPAGSEVSPSRAEALHDCARLEQKVSPTVRDSNLSIFEYRACMQERGQP